MSSLVGNYEHVRDENTDEYFKCVGKIYIRFFRIYVISSYKCILFLGVPYVIRKMMLMTSPKLMIQHDVDDKWIIQITTLMRTSGMAFRIGEEFQEFMPNGVTLTVKMLAIFFLM